MSDEQNITKKRHWVGYNYEPPKLTVHQELHWYEKYKLGYRPIKTNWPERDIDDDRFNLKEPE